MKENIIRAAAKIISNKGLESASTRAICESVGITAPTLYYHFKNKEDLLNAVTQFTYDRHRQNKSIKKTGESLHNLKIYWDEYILFAQIEPDLHRSMLVAVSQGRVQNGLSCFRDLYHEFKVLEAEGRLQQKALLSAQMYLGAAQGISLIFMASPEKTDWRQLSQNTRDVMLNGLIKTRNDA